MKHLPKPPRRRRHAAMNDDEGRDDHRERARTGRGVKPSQPQAAASGSPHEATKPPKASESRHRPSASASASASARPEPSSSQHRRRRSRDRSRSRSRSRNRSTHLPPSDPSRRPGEVEDLIPRYRANKERHREAEDRPRHRSRSRERERERDRARDRDRDRGRDRGRNLDASASSKRHRSRSRSPSPAHRSKRSKRGRSPRSRARDHSPESGSRKRDRHSPRDRRKPSPRHHHRSPTSPTRSEGQRSRPQHTTVSKSPVRPDTKPPRGERDSRHRSRSRTPRSDSRPSSSKRPRPSPREDAVLQSSAPSDRPVDHDRRQPNRDPPRSPKPHRDRDSRPDGETPDRHRSSRSDIDDEMTSRGGYRGGYNPMYAQKSQLGGDAQDYSQSPHPGGSFTNSPAQSPYGGGRGGRSRQHHYSPQQQYPSQHPQGSNFGPPNGPSGHYHSNQSHSAPYSAPTDPMQQYPQNNYRGGYRGGSYRGGPFAGRGGNRGTGFKNSHWNSSTQQRGHHEDDERYNPSDAQGDADEPNPDAMDLEADHFPQPADSQPDNPAQEGKPEADATVAPSREPPSGPGSQAGGAKFSFAFKASSKPTPAAPKPEISQKFNAAPQRREPAKDNRSREPPRSAPTEPASARSRHEFRNPPDGPKMAPRMRKVKKTMKRPKPRPTLPPDHANSESVFFRKPGNESVVGSGTYGKVFKALNVYTKGQVALKRIRMEGERDGFPVTAVREIKLLQSLRHKNVVNLQEVMVEKNDCFMVFEYLSHDLTGLLNHPSFKLDAAQKKHLAQQLFEGLDYLHTRGVLHRDIKAANILVSNEGVLKLADFGLARFYAKRHQLDYTNRVITIWYRSPELLLGETQYTPAVDVWSAACVMFEIFLRNAIFAGDGTELSQLEKIYNIMGTPDLRQWPGLVDMAWFELLRPTVKRKSVFADKYKDKVTPAAFDLLAIMFRYDPAKRPTAAEVLQHPYFVSEEPLARQAIELSSIDGDWHEFESKALRKENERKDREARRAAKEGQREKDKKRSNDDHPQRDAKRVHVENKSKEASSEATTSKA